MLADAGAVPLPQRLATAAARLGARLDLAASPPKGACAAARPGGARRGSARRCRSGCSGGEVTRRGTGRPAHGDDGRGEGRAQPGVGDQGFGPQGGGVDASCGSPAACTSSPAGWSSRPSWTPARWPAGCAGRSTSCTGRPPTCRCCPPAGIRKGTRYLVRVVNGGDSLARQTGLLDQRGRPVRGLPPQIVAGTVGDSEAAWRGAFLAHGSLTEPGRSAVAGGDLPGPRGGTGAGRRRPPDGYRRQGQGGSRRRPGGGPGRRRDLGPADPARRAHVGAGLGGAADAPRGAGDRQSAGQLRRRQPATLGPRRGRRRGQGRAGAGDPR